MNQIQNIESSNWIQNTLTINTKNGAYPVRYWWNGATALVASTDGCEDACIDDSTHRSDKSRGKITALQFATSSLLQNFRADRTPSFYDLTEWLKYLSAKIKPIREAFVEVGAGCLSGFATDGLRGMLIKGLGMTEAQASLTVVKSYDDSVGYLLDTVDEEGLDALEVITKDREERMKEAFAQRRARLQAEKKAKTLEAEMNNPKETGKIEDLYQQLCTEYKLEYKPRSFDKIVSGKVFFKAEKDGKLRYTVKKQFVDFFCIKYDPAPHYAYFVGRRSEAYSALKKLYLDWAEIDITPRLPGFEE